MKMKINELCTNLSVLKKYIEDPKKWEKFVKRYSKKELNGSDIISFIISDIEDMVNDIFTRKLVNIKEGGWLDGLKYAQKLIGSEVYRTWTIAGKKVVIPVLVKEIKLEADDVYLVTEAYASKNTKHVKRNLSLRDYHVTWTCHRQSCEALIGERSNEN